jgi:hypothetical protein
MPDSNRRAFFKNLLQEVVGNAVHAFHAGSEEKRREQDIEAFFSSYESSYAVTLNYPDEILLESARQAGIRTEGREKIDIVRELFLKHGGESHRP